MFRFTHIFLNTEDTKKKSYPMPLRNSSLRDETHKKKTVQSGKYHNGSFQKETKTLQGEKSFWRRLHVKGDSYVEWEKLET